MAFPEIFKKTEKKQVFEKKEKVNIKDKKTEEKPAKEKAKKATGFYANILESPHITEKATDLSEKNQYVFKVFSKTNKKEIKNAVEEIYKVDVISVNIINIPDKKRRLGRTLGWKSGYKKAIVGIKAGQKIELMPR
ncbi:MAG: 50S ribosomal protein L23 [Candidatus Pacebacteria bacterium]|nr:50S ribosomal protein L23 [Candidatus Paceibacterota bacterium]